MKCWINTKIRLNDSWGQGAVHTLTTPVGEQPELAIRPRHLRDTQGSLQLAHFSIDFPSGYLADGWNGLNLIPLGSKPATGISGLPEWSPAVEQIYRKAIESDTSLGESHTERLEGVVPYLGSTGGIGYNKVRLFYIRNAVKGKVPDLIVIKISTHAMAKGTIQGQQDGNGHGPPG